MTTHRIPLRTVTCQGCGKFSFSALKDRDLCSSCYRREPSDICSRCLRPFHKYSDSLKLCPVCTRIMSRPTGECTRCGRHTSLVNQYLSLCQRCHELSLRQKRDSRRRTVNIQCSVCQQFRNPALTTRLICHRCLLRERTYVRRCNGCQQVKPLRVKGRGLCKRCYDNLSASRLLRKYVATFATPHQDSLKLFHILCQTIIWESVTEDRRRAVTAFGQYLKTHRLHVPNTWEQLDAMLPKLGSTGRTRTLLVRKGLRDIAHYLAKAGQLENRTDHVTHQGIKRLLDNLPASASLLLTSYKQHLEDTKHRNGGIKRQIEVLTSFVDWCGHTSIGFPHEIQTTQITAYLRSLYDHWTCTKCNWVIPSKIKARYRALSCPLCRTKSLMMRPGKSYQTVRVHHSCLKMFFMWAKLTHRVMNNPVEGIVKAPKQTLKQYDLEVVLRIFEYIRNPHSDPIGALMTYLILCHMLTVWEIRHVRLPLFTIKPELPTGDTLSEYYRVYVPRREISRSNHSPGRPDPWVHFARSASSWLKPLLDRFEHKRRETSADSANDYLFVAPNRSRHPVPVSSTFVWEQVGQFSQQAVGLVCRPKILRTSAALLFVDNNDAGVLHAMGWKNQQAYVYSYAPRVTVVPPSNQAKSSPIESPR